uniref:N-terminal methionine N(alpha)-acetyltransferase NatE n=1 Tax=Caenorhabditis tropicalis TaxID=1561998 RepID=A0A1I7U1Z9_9PELO
MSSDNNQMASTSDQPPQVAPTQARNDIPMKAATRLSLPPNTVEKMVALQNNLHIETFKEGNLQQRMKELRVLANINADEAEDEFFENVERNPHLTAIALYNKRAVGYISCKMISNDMALYVYHIGVLPKYRKRGIGSALMHYAITNIAEKLTSLVGLILHVYDYEEDLIRLFSRFGFTDNPRGQRKEDPESWRVYNRLANEKVDVKEPPRKKYKEEPVEITIEVVTDDNMMEIPAINTKSRDIEDSDDLYMAVARFPHLSAFAILNGEKIGVMSCAEIEQNEYKQYLIMSLGVVPEHVVFKGKVFELLLKHAISTAEKTDDIEMVTYFCKNGDDVPFKLMNRLNFHLWKPYEDFYDNTYEDKQLFIKPIEKNLPQLANIANDSDDMDD